MWLGFLFKSLSLKDKDTYQNWYGRIVMSGFYLKIIQLEVGGGSKRWNIIGHQLTMLDDAYRGSIILLSLILWTFAIFHNKMLFRREKTHFQLPKESQLVFLTTHSQANMTVAWLSICHPDAHPDVSGPELAAGIQNIRPGPFPSLCPHTYCSLYQKSLSRPPDTLLRPRATSLRLFPFPSRLPLYFFSP